MKQETRRDKKIIWILLLIVVVMGVVKFTYKSETEPRVTVGTPTVIPTPSVAIEEATISAVPTQRYERNYDDYPLWAKLPYYGKGFVVDRYTAPLTLAVKTKGLSKTIVKKAVEKWLGENGIDPATHKLIFE